MKRKNLLTLKKIAACAIATSMVVNLNACVKSGSVSTTNNETSTVNETGTIIEKVTDKNGKVEVTTKVITEVVTNENKEVVTESNGEPVTTKEILVEEVTKVINLNPSSTTAKSTSKADSTKKDSTTKATTKPTEKPTEPASEKATEKATEKTTAATAPTTTVAPTTTAPKPTEAPTTTAAPKPTEAPTTAPVKPTGLTGKQSSNDGKVSIDYDAHICYIEGCPFEMFTIGLDSNGKLAYIPGNDFIRCVSGGLRSYKWIGGNLYIEDPGSDLDFLSNPNFAYGISESYYTMIDGTIYLRILTNYEEIKSIYITAFNQARTMNPERGTPTREAVPVEKFNAAMCTGATNRAVTLASTGNLRHELDWIKSYTDNGDASILGYSKKREGICFANKMMTYIEVFEEGSALARHISTGCTIEYYKIGFGYSYSTATGEPILAWCVGAITKNDDELEWSLGD